MNFHLESMYATSHFRLSFVFWKLRSMCTHDLQNCTALCIKFLHHCCNVHEYFSCKCMYVSQVFLFMLSKTFIANNSHVLTKNYNAVFLYTDYCRQAWQGATIILIPFILIGFTLLAWTVYAVIEHKKKKCYNQEGKLDVQITTNESINN